MRIALLSGEYPPQPGGIGDYTRALGSALAALGHGSVVLTIQGGQLLCYDLAAAERAPEPIAPVRGWGWASWTALRRALAELQPDVLHIQYQTGAFAMHPAINFLPWRLRAQTPRPRIAVTAHDLLPPYLFPKAGPARRRVTAALLACADALVLTNRADLATAAEMARRPATLIPIGSNIDAAPPPDFNRAAWRARLGVEAEQPLIAFFGLLSRSKGVDTLLAALAQVPSDARLLVVGGEATAPADRAYAAALQRTIAANGLSERVTITGHCPPADVSAHLLAADVVALPFADGASFRRGSLLAALAHGRPVVTTQPATPTPELADGENVLLIPPGDAPALAIAMRRVLADTELRARLETNGLALAQQFGWQAIARQHEALYTGMLARKT
jgi:glycosyltransferase involved in cell wall biosynthesis